MAAYVIFNYLQVFDEERILDYRRQAHPTVGKYGGRVNVGPGEMLVLEGPASCFMIIAEFADMASARAWYESPEYQAARAIREQAAEVQVSIVPVRDR